MYFEFIDNLYVEKVNSYIYYFHPLQINYKKKKNKVQP